MKHPQITFHSLVPASDVLAEFMALGRKMPAQLAMVECKNITERLVKERAAALILPQINDVFEFHQSVYDTYEGSTDQEAWTDEMDNAIEALLDSYSLSITQDFIGRYCVSTRFHLPVARSAKAEANVLADAFAADVWRVLIHDTDEDAEPPRVLSTAKILSAVGIVKDDLAELMGDMPDNAPQVKQRETKPMRSMNEILNDVHMMNGLLVDPATMKEYFSMAIDSDDGISVSGTSAMGIEVDDAATLRIFAAECGANAGDEFITALQGAPYEDDVTDSAPDVDVEVEGTDGDDAEMLALMGGAAPALPAPPVAPPSAPASPTTPAAQRAPVLPGGNPGTVDKRALTLIREHVKMKDEDVAAGIGVSRQTYINYADPAKKATLVASEAQREFLRSTVKAALLALEEAYTLLG